MVLDKSGNTLFTVPLDHRADALTYDASLDQVWVISGRTVSRYDATGNQVLSSRLRADVSDHVAPDGQGNLWAAGDHILGYISQSGNLVFTHTPFASDPDHDGDIDRLGRIVDLVADPLNHTAWVADARYLKQYATDGTLKQTIDIQSFTDSSPCYGDTPGRGTGGDNNDSSGNGRCGRSLEWGRDFWSDRGVHHVALYVDTIPPTITFTAPKDLSYTNHKQPSFSLAWNDAGSGVDSTTLKVTRDGAPLAVNCQTEDSGAQCNVTSALSDGTYTLSATVADYAGNVSAPASITFTIDTVPPPLPAAALTEFEPGPAGTVTLNGEAGSVVSDVASVSVNNIRTGQKVTGTVNGNGSFSIPIGGTSSDEFAITLTDLAGNVTVPFYMHGGDSAMQLTIASPAAGATITGNVINVTGTFLGPINTGITVNGAPAILSDGEWVADNVVLTAGMNNLIVVATTSGGLTLTRTVNVTSSTSTSLILTATPAATGIAPFTATFGYQFLGTTAPQSLKIDYVGNGNYVAVTDPNATLSYTYTSPGVYPVTLILTDSNNAQYQAQLLVVVQDAGQMDALFKGIWGDMTTALASGDKAAAMNELDHTATQTLSPVFDELMPHMKDIVSAFTPLLQSSVSATTAEYVEIRNVTGQQRAYFVYFLRGEDGVWRVGSM